MSSETNQLKADFRVTAAQLNRLFRVYDRAGFDVFLEICGDASVSAKAAHKALRRLHNARDEFLIYAGGEERFPETFAEFSRGVTRARASAVKRLARICHTQDLKNEYADAKNHINMVFASMRRSVKTIKAELALREINL